MVFGRSPLLALQSSNARNQTHGRLRRGLWFALLCRSCASTRQNVSERVFGTGLYDGQVSSSYRAAYCTAADEPSCKKWVRFGFFFLFGVGELPSAFRGGLCAVDVFGEPSSTYKPAVGQTAIECATPVVWLGGCQQQWCLWSSAD